MPVRRAAGLAAGGRGIEETRTRRAVTATRERLATRKSRCRKHPETSYDMQTMCGMQLSAMRNSSIKYIKFALPSTAPLLSFCQRAH